MISATSFGLGRLSISPPESPESFKKIENDHGTFLVSSGITKPAAYLLRYESYSQRGSSKLASAD